MYLRLKKYKDCIETCKIGFDHSLLLGVALSLDPNNEAVLRILGDADKATAAKVITEGVCDD